MKKIVFALAFMMSFCSNVYSAQPYEFVHSIAVVENQSRVDKVGFNLLNSNGIETRAVFDFHLSSTKIINLCS